VASVDPVRDRALASRDLVRRAHLDRLVAVGVASFERLPFADASFTHAWCVHALEAQAERSQVFAELFRVLRPGGHLALQEWVARVGRAGLSEHATAEAYLEALRTNGFRGGHAEPAGSLREDESTIAGIVRERVTLHLGPPSVEEHASLERTEARLRPVERAVAEGRLELVQVFAHKPT